MHVCTIVARNYLAQARVLGRSLAATNPGTTLWVLVVDGVHEGLDEPFALVDPQELELGSDLAVMRLKGRTTAELGDRRDLLAQMDRLKGAMDSVGMDSQYRRAFDVLTSSKMLQAIDVSREPDNVRERYGRGSTRAGSGLPWPVSPTPRWTSRTGWCRTSAICVRPAILARK